MTAISRMLREAENATILFPWAEGLSVVKGCGDGVVVDAEEVVDEKVVDEEVVEEEVVDEEVVDEEVVDEELVEVDLVVVVLGEQIQTVKKKSNFISNEQHDSIFVKSVAGKIFWLKHPYP